METVQNLLILYCGVILVNLAISFLQWNASRTPLYRDLLAFWASMLAGFLLQAVLVQNSLALATGFASVFFMHLALAFVVAGVVKVPLEWRRLSGFMVGAWCLGAVAFLSGAPFWAVSLPIALGAAMPLLIVVGPGFAKWKTLSGIEIALLVAALVSALHALDYPFLRDKPEFAGLGFTIGILTVLAIAVLGPTCAAEAQGRRRRRVLATQAETLAQAIQQLEHFSHATAHDLRESLRHLIAYSDLLEECLPAEAPKDCLTYVHRIRAAGLRLDNLVDNMLDHARSEYAEIRREDVALDDVFQEAMDTLSDVIAATGAEITVAPLPTVVADPSMLVLVARNLLGNALRFKGAGPVRIHVGASEEAGLWRVSVRDEGAGIPLEHRARIFEPFFRLHAPGDGGGSGVGLSICKRIVESHGGTIEVVSEPEVGSTFSFTLPPEGPA